jgi:hypothetical protein
MKFKRYAVLAALALSLAAQTKETYKARLSPVPADARTRADLTGSGSATAMLAGTTLTINGSFEGLKTPVTTVNLHAAVAAGVRGQPIADLVAPKAINGTITGTIELTPPQIENLHHGGLYVEIHTEKAPEGALWGWLLK